MKLNTKVLFVIGVAWLTFLVVVYAGARGLMLNSFLALEQDRANRDLSRVDQALTQVHRSLFTFTSDWSHWDELANYMQGKNPNFVTNNLTMSTYLNLDINLLMLWTNDAILKIGTLIDTQHRLLQTLPKSTQDYFYSNSLLLKSYGINKNIQGYLLVDNKILLVAAAAITDNAKTTSLGTMVVGRYLSPNLIQQISDTTKLTITLLTLDIIARDPYLQATFNENIHSKNQHLIKPINYENLKAYTLIKDVHGKPIGMLQIAAPRVIFLTGLKTIHYFLSIFLVLGVSISLLMLWLLRVLIVRRLEKLDDQVGQIKASQEASARVDASGDDEVSSVSAGINSLLDTIQTSQEELEQRVQSRTQELQQSNNQLQQEIAERKSIEKDLIIHKENLVKLAHYDSLTSLPNRVFFNEILNKALNHAARQKKILAVLFIDLDRFKTINDALGHSVGDLVLKEISNRFSHALRAGDILARLGGDEFIILLNDIGQPKYASLVAEKLLQTCVAPVIVNGREFYLTASIGICIFPNDGTSLEDLQRNADMAMYKSKRAGGNIFQYFTQEMNNEAHEHIQLESALRTAIANNEFTLYYQPKIYLNKGTIQGVEALIRWEHPARGMISPANFIGLAEETGLIMPIGEWALREACRMNKHWQNQGYQPIVISVNLSAKQFRHQDISYLVKTILDETGLEAKYLELEITETAVMDSLDEAIHKLSTLKKMGVSIAMDDFGTGYTSISYLKQFPIDVIKIDQSFIKGIPQNANDVAITSAVIGLAHSLNIQVVAEGVETADQFQYLTAHNCDLIQGYYISRPLPEKKIVLQFTKISEPYTT